MEAACKAASRTAQLLTKDTSQEEVSQMMAVMASIKEQLSKVSEKTNMPDFILNPEYIMYAMYLTASGYWQLPVTL